MTIGLPFADAQGPPAVLAYPKTARSFIGYPESKSDCLRTHYHFQIFFSPDNRAARHGFMYALEEAFNLGDDLIMTEDPSAKFLVSIPDKIHNKVDVQFLQSSQPHVLGTIHFTSAPADEEIPFCGSAAYDAHDFYAASHLLIEFRRLPLHLRTLRTAECMLQPYGVATEVKPNPDSSAERSVFQCFCWTDAPTSLPSRIKIKVKRRFGNVVTSSGQPILDMFIVHVKVVDTKLQESPHSFQSLPPVPNFQEGTLG